MGQKHAYCIVCKETLFEITLREEGPKTERTYDTILEQRLHDMDQGIDGNFFTYEYLLKPSTVRFFTGNCGWSEPYGLPIHNVWLRDLRSIGLPTHFIIGTQFIFHHGGGMTVTKDCLIP